VKTFLAAVALLAVAGVGLALGWVAHSEDVERSTVTGTARSADGALPPAVERTRAAIERAAQARDFAALRRLIPEHGFSFTFGEFEGDAVEYWQNLERSSDERPFATLARVVALPYTLRQGSYVWPFAYGTPKNELTQYERSLLGDLADSYAGTDYYGWRAGIRPDGTWIFFIRGD
jgi:hypothetical protein